MRVIDTFRTNEPVLDRWTFVLEEQEPDGSYAMIAASDDTSPGGICTYIWGQYDPEGLNEHLGERRSFTPEDVGQLLFKHIVAKLSEGDEL